MRKRETPIKYVLMSGDEEILKTKTIKEIYTHINSSFGWIYANKNKDINKDGTWSFNFKDINYTIITL